MAVVAAAAAAAGVIGSIATAAIAEKEGRVGDVVGIMVGVQGLVVAVALAV
jgi:hypothetical protein